jgi:hypothetical protein
LGTKNRVGRVTGTTAIFILGLSILLKVLVHVVALPCHWYHTENIISYLLQDHSRDHFETGVY